MPCCKAEEYKWCKDIPDEQKDVYRDEQGNEYCVFHAPKEKKIIKNNAWTKLRTEEFNELVFERIKQAKGLCDLSGTVFEGEISFSRFDKDNPLPEIDFSKAAFNEKAYFSGAKFGEKAYFYGATFGEKAYSVYAEFNEKADFLGAAFSEKASFSGAIFSKEAYFYGTTFGEKADFSEAKFGEKAYFSRAKFGKEADFSGVAFGKEAYFYGETFGEKADFIDTSIEGEIRFEKVNLEKASFIDTDLRKMDFISYKWPKKHGRDVLYDEIALFEKKKGKDFNNEIKKVENLYRLLKQKYKEAHNEPEVSNWHYGEKEMFRKRSNWRRYLPSLTTLYWLSSGYGERPLRAGVFLLSLIFAISLLMSLTGLVPLREENIYGISEIKGLKFWALILNTLQYATFQKETILKPASLIGGYIKLAAQILIPLQAALLAFAVRNRFRR